MARDWADPDDQLAALRRAVTLVRAHAAALQTVAAQSGSPFIGLARAEADADVRALRAIERERCPHPYGEVSNLHQEEGQGSRCDVCDTRWDHGDPPIVQAEPTPHDEGRCRATRVEGDAESRCYLNPNHDSAHFFPAKPAKEPAP